MENFSPVRQSGIESVRAELAPMRVALLLAMSFPSLAVAIMAWPLMGLMLSAIGVSALGLSVLATRHSGGFVLGQRRAMGSSDKIIWLLIDILLIAYTYPQALTAIFTANTSGWSTSGQSLWPVVGLMAELGALVIIIKSAL